jgi:hypothetical protein
MERRVRGDGYVEITAVLEEAAVEAVDSTVRATGASPDRVLSQLVIDGADFRNYAEQGGTIVVEREHESDLRIALHPILPDNVIPLRRLRSVPPPDNIA